MRLTTHFCIIMLIFSQATESSHRSKRQNSAFAKRGTRSSKRKRGNIPARPESGHERDGELTSILHAMQAFEEAQSSCKGRVEL